MYPFVSSNRRTGNKLATIFVDGNKQQFSGNMLPWCKRVFIVSFLVRYVWSTKLATYQFF